MRSISRILLCVVSAFLLLAGAQTASAAVHPAAAAKTIYYDASGAPDYQDVIAAAVQNWNGDVKNVQIQPASGSNKADFTIGEDNDWPRTYPGQQVGTGQIVIGKTAVDQGFDKTRIAAHEMGHILGLPDNRDGQCTTLMSGHSAPVSCTDAQPNDAERQQVEQNFSGAQLAHRAVPAVYDECYPAHTAALSR